MMGPGKKQGKIRIMMGPCKKKQGKEPEWRRGPLRPGSCWRRSISWGCRGQRTRQLRSASCLQKDKYII